MRLAPRTLLLAALTLTTLHASARAARVTGLSAANHRGQTFLTWTSPAGTGWTYRVYASNSPILSGADLAVAMPLGSVGDSTWCDRRLSSVRQQTYGFRTDSLATPLGSTQGLFVATPASAGVRYYAVTAQAFGDPEDTAITPGIDALQAPVAEPAAVPRPVYQRTVYEGYGPVDVYTLWTSDTDAPGFPAMANRPSVPYDCGICVGGASPNNALMVCGHYRGSDFLQPLAGSGQSGEWRLSVDDVVRNVDGNTFFYGYHTGYDIYGDDNPPPTGGTVVDYTMRRVVHAICWARSAFPVDTCRVYAMGISMGGTLSAFLGLVRPDLVAATYAMVPKVDFSYQDIMGNPFLASFEAQWGALATAPPSSEGYPVYDRLNAGFLAGLSEARGLPPMVMFSGKHDDTVGWGEKIGYYQSMNAHRLGGCFFFDQRYHSTSFSNYWGPMQDARYLYRFRSDLSFPAFSNCSANGDPGDGDPWNGDLQGSLNGFMDWDTSLVDHADRWEIVLRLRNLSSHSGPVAAPDSLTVDVTPRRLQQLHPVRGQIYSFSATRLSDGASLGQGLLAADSMNLLTVRGVRVMRAGTRLSLTPTGAVAAPDVPARPLVVTAGNPVRGSARFSVTWPTAGEAEVKLVSSSGRIERCLMRQRVAQGTMQLSLDAHGLSSGVYWVVARLGGAQAATRIVFLR